MFWCIVCLWIISFLVQKAMQKTKTRRAIYCSLFTTSVQRGRVTRGLVVVKPHLGAYNESPYQFQRALDSAAVLTVIWGCSRRRCLHLLLLADSTVLTRLRDSVIYQARGLRHLFGKISSCLDFRQGRLVSSASDGYLVWWAITGVP